MIKLVRWREFLWLLLWNTDDKFGVQNYYDLSFSERKKSVLREWEDSEQRRDVIPFISLKFRPNQAGPKEDFFVKWHFQIRTFLSIFVTHSQISLSFYDYTVQHKHSQRIYTHPYSSLWTHTRKPYSYEYLRRLDQQIYKIDEVTVNLAIDGNGCLRGKGIKPLKLEIFAATGVLAWQSVPRWCTHKGRRPCST